LEFDLAEPSHHSVSAWIANLKAGDALAAQKLWERYSIQLARLADRHLRSTPRRVADEEDIALQAFASLCSGAADRRFPKLLDRDDLWQLLFVITERKAIDLIKSQNRQKRGGGAVRGESVFAEHEEDLAQRGIEQVIDSEPTPAYAALAADECRCLLDQLRDESLRRVALMKLEGFTNKEVAEQLGCVERTVERKLEGIRCIWQEELSHG